MTRRPAPPLRAAVGERAAEVGYAAVRLLTTVTDLVPPRHRFGKWQSVLGLLRSRRALPTLERDEATSPASPQCTDAPEVQEGPVRCLIVSGALDAGGVETVVASLARGLGAHGIEPEVVCSTPGRIAADLRDAGCPVAVVPPADLASFVRSRRPDVIQAHRADPRLLAALQPSAARTQLVFHAIEAYLDAGLWLELARFLRRAPRPVAVSRAVRQFVQSHTGVPEMGVIVNGIPPAPQQHLDRSWARARVSAAVSSEIRPDDLLVVGMQRYSDQKNTAGLVDAFLRAAELDPRLRLAVAGGPDNWLEFRRADLVRRCHPRGGRVHLLGDSDPGVLLAAADAFALDSFAEGGPVAALEAVAAGVPVVLSDVGFARDLVDASPGSGLVVRRANRELTGASVARARRARHQRNRDEFAAALLRVADRPPLAGADALPDEFTREAMLAAYADALREAAVRAGDEERSIKK